MERTNLLKEKEESVEKEKQFLIQVIYMKGNLTIINLMGMDIIYGLRMDMNIKEII